MVCLVDSMRSLRILLDPVLSSDGSQPRAHAVRLSFTNLGSGLSRAKIGVPLPATIAFAARYLQRVRGGTPAPPVEFAALSGRISLRGDALVPTFEFASEGEQIVHSPAIEDDTPSAGDKTAQRSRSPRRVFRLDVDPAQFRGAAAGELLLFVPGESEPSQLLEVFASLQIDGGIEAPFTVNDVADVPLRRLSEFPIPSQKVAAVQVEQPLAAPILLADASDVLGQSSDTATDAFVPLVESSAARLDFTEGPAQRPEIKHDHGFLTGADGNLDTSKVEAPTLRDRALLVTWIARLRGAQLLRADLLDATNAYEHFLFGGGAPFAFSYEKFIRADTSGRQVLSSVVEDVVAAAIAIHSSKVNASPASAKTDSFEMTSTLISVGADDRFPYPATENWQKAIGGHAIWADATVTAVTAPDLKRTFTILLTLHAEDMYNFNPGAADIATNIPDAENGRFEVTRLAHEFVSASTLTRRIDCQADTLVPGAKATNVRVSGPPIVARPAPGASPTLPSPPAALPPASP